ncbi:MAG: sigma-70 family RNA polymerase sigma factor [Bacteroidota bacterium]
MDQLINRLQAGDNSAVKDLYQQYYHHCKWVVLNNGGSNEEAQEVFFSLWEKVERTNFTINSTLKGYLYNACKYQWWDVKKKSDNAVSLEVAHNVAYEEEREEKIHQEERYKLLYSCIEELGGECEQLLEQTYFENLSDKEIASVFKLKLNYVRIKRKRCMDRVKKCVRQKQKYHG